MDQFGCEECWSLDASKAWETVMKVSIEEYLINESHYIVSIRRCPSCSQRYLQITTETIDWKDGKDPIFRTIIPIDEDEHSRLTTNSPPDTNVLESVGQGRRSLKYDCPKGQEPSTYWGVGVCVGVHD